MDLGVPAISPAPMARNIESPPNSGSPTENWGLISLLPTSAYKSIIYIRPRVDLGVPAISAVPMARNTENQRFFKDSCWKQEHSSANSTIAVFAGLHQYRCLQPKIQARISIVNFCLLSFTFTPRVDLGVLLLLGHDVAVVVGVFVVRGGERVEERIEFFLLVVAVVVVLLLLVLL